MLDLSGYSADLGQRSEDPRLDGSISNTLDAGQAGERRVQLVYPHGWLSQLQGGLAFLLRSLLELLFELVGDLGYLGQLADVCGHLQ